MRKIKIIFSILVSLILLIGISNKSNAITISTSGTPSSVDSGSEFSIILKFDEKVMGFNAHISYDPSLVTMSAESTNPNLSINPTYAEGDLALIYTVMQESAAEDTFEIKVKAADITEQKVAQFEISKIEIATASSMIGETLNDSNVSVTIKPVQEIPDGKEEPSNQYTGNNLAKTGENEILLFVIAGLIISAIIVKLKSKKIL